MSVYIDGSTLSHLLFSHFNSSGNQYGILLGERTDLIEDKISDSQIHSESIKSYTTISSFIPWQNSEDHIYSRNGTVNEEALKQLIPRSRDQAVLGWYSFRHQASNRPSMKENNLHRSLSSCPIFEGSPQDFLFFLCTSCVERNSPTHNCKHSFFKYTNGTLSTVSMVVMNLGDTTRKEYRKESNVTLSHNSHIKATFAKQRQEFVTSNEEMYQVVKMQDLAESMNKSLMNVHGAVVESEFVVSQLEHDVLCLQQQLFQLEQEAMLKLQQEDNIQEDNLQEDLNLQQEKEEKAELDKLLKDLGIDHSVELVDRDGQSAVRHLPVDTERQLATDTGSQSSNPTGSDGQIDEHQIVQAFSVKEPKANESRVKTAKEEPFAFVEEAVRLEKESAHSKNCNSHKQVDFFDSETDSEDRPSQPFTTNCATVEETLPSSSPVF